MNGAIRSILKRAIPAGLRPGIRALYRRVHYFGFRYTCPFCRARLRTFRPFGLKLPVFSEKRIVGGGYRLNASCPVCDSIERERLIYLFLLNKTGIFESPHRILHIAPEKRLADILFKHASAGYFTADLYLKSVMLNLDLTEIPFADTTFDAIMCNHVLEHIVNDHKAMSELYRILKIGGWAILQVPISSSLEKTYEDRSVTTPAGREESFGQADHVRIYAMDYVDRLEQAGFSVDIFKWVDEAESFGGRNNRFGLNENECIFLATKHA